MGSCIMLSEKLSGTLRNLGALSPAAFFHSTADYFTRRSENGSHILTPGKKNGARRKANPILLYLQFDSWSVRFST